MLLAFGVPFLFVGVRNDVPGATVPSWRAFKVALRDLNQHRCVGESDEARAKVDGRESFYKRRFGSLHQQLCINRRHTGGTGTG
jgi:hypothetical protein